MSPLTELAELSREFDSEAAEVADRASWEVLRVRWQGRKRGIVRQQLAAFKDVPPDQKRDYGQAVNQLKRQVEARLAELEASLAVGVGTAGATTIDVTLPGRQPMVGTIHPVSRVAAEIVDIFMGLGYSVAEGPEIEEDYYNFEALNFPPDHPARDTQDTFFLRDGRLLRTHTSPVQIRTMKARKPPIRILCLGKTFRNDNDLRHSPMFHQVEGLAVAEGITFGHLKGTLEAFLKRLFGPETGVRLRPSYFPFTEPSAEVDITCTFCKGDGCQVCSQTGWMEILGAGMVDPRVLEECGIDPDRNSGFAFGLGLDRVAMNRYGIPNIRVLFDNDERLLRQVKR